MEFIYKDDFCKKLYETYNYGYTIDTKKMSQEQLDELFKTNLQEKIINRIEFLYDKSNCFVIEDNYIEREWKAMISKHYINSAYSTTLKQSAIRIHFLRDNNFKPENYLGFITLRPLEELDISLSFVYLNWNHSMFEGQETRVMTYKKEIHCMGENVIIETYPFFAQDTIVTCCADANIIMLKKYFSNKYKLYLNWQNDVFSSKVIKKHNLPKTIDSLAFPNMLSESEIPFRVKPFNKSKLDKVDSKKIEDEILAYIESGLPVVLTGDRHVIQLIGHTRLDDSQEIKFIVYDDSGYLEKIVCEENKRHIIYLVSVSDLVKYFNSEKRKGFNLFFLEHERVYIGYEKYAYFLKEYLIQQSNRDTDKKSVISQIFDEYEDPENKCNGQNVKIKEYKQNVKIRTLLADNSEVKKFFNDNKTNQELQNAVIAEFVKKALPHYLWYTEITTEENSTFCLCADPTMYHRTRDYMKLFLDTGKRMIIGLKQGEHLSLLTEGQ